MKDRGVKVFLDKERMLLYDLNALEEIEYRYETLGSALGKIDELSLELDLDNPKYNFGFFIDFIHLGLLHDDETLTRKQVGKILDFDRMMDLVGKIPGAIFLDSGDEESKN